MLESNIGAILDTVPPGAKVLDIGGWAQPFNRADWVLDILPYETRGVFGHTGSVRATSSREPSRAKGGTVGVEVTEGKGAADCID